MGSKRKKSQYKYRDKMSKNSVYPPKVSRVSRLYQLEPGYDTFSDWDQEYEDEEPEYEGEEPEYESAEPEYEDSAGIVEGGDPSYQEDSLELQWGTQQEAAQETQQEMLQGMQQKILQQTQQELRWETQQEAVQETQQEEAQETQQEMLQEIQEKILQETQQQILQETQQEELQGIQQKILQETQQQILKETQQEIPQETQQEIQLIIPQAFPQETPQETPQENMQEILGRQKKKFRKLVTALVVYFMIVFAAAGGYVYYELPRQCVKKVVTIEAGGSCPSVSSFLEWENEKASIVSGIDENTELDHVQDYEVVIHLYHQDITATLQVVDTIPPRIWTKDKTIMLGEEFELNDFVDKISDVTECEVAYKEVPEIQGPGSYSVVLNVKDEGGNTTEAEALLTVLQDVTPPVIEGVSEMTITVGGSVSYKKNVTVTDDYDDSVQLVIDNSEVDVDTPGDYTVYYRATDKYGNKTEVSTILHVKKPVVVDSVVVTEEIVNEAADKILASITDSSMSQYEIIEAIYKWCNKKIAYVNGTPKTDWIVGAYHGIVKQRGDCFAFAMASKCLLTRAGITNMDIERIRVGNGMHFWNLVDIGEGWHHFDTCRRGDGVTFFYLTDAELMEYSNSHTAPDYPDGSHHYDRSLYPEIP